MYLLMVVGLMLVAPVASIICEHIAVDGTELLSLAAKWSVFWAVGVRLLVAGLRQVTKPSFTARDIFKIADPAAEKLVTEIGFGNLVMGTVAVLTLAFPNWLVPAGLTGSLYLVLAGLKHMANKERNQNENVAMISDLIVGGLVLGLVRARGFHAFNAT